MNLTVLQSNVLPQTLSQRCQTEVELRQRVCIYRSFGFSVALRFSYAKWLSLMYIRNTEKLCKIQTTGLVGACRKNDQ
jgi:hypothetical protein